MGTPHRWAGQETDIGRAGLLGPRLAPAASQSRGRIPRAPGRTVRPDHLRPIHSGPVPPSAAARPAPAPTLEMVRRRVAGRSHPDCSDASRARRAYRPSGPRRLHAGSRRLADRWGYGSHTARVPEIPHRRSRWRETQPAHRAADWLIAASPDWDLHQVAPRPWRPDGRG